MNSRCFLNNHGMPDLRLDSFNHVSGELNKAPEWHPKIQRLKKPSESPRKARIDTRPFCGMNGALELVTSLHNYHHL